MIVHGTLTHQVQIDPMDVLYNLKYREIGTESWVKMGDDGKYYKVWDESYGSHSREHTEEISKELYDYIQSIQHIINYNKQ